MRYKEAVEIGSFILTPADIGAKIDEVVAETKILDADYARNAPAIQSKRPELAPSWEQTRDAIYKFAADHAGWFSRAIGTSAYDVAEDYQKKLVAYRKALQDLGLTTSLYTPAEGTPKAGIPLWGKLAIGGVLGYLGYKLVTGSGK